MMEYPTPSLLEPYISTYFLSSLSTLHYTLMSKTDQERLSMPNTTSMMYNFSLLLNMSTSPEDTYFRESFHVWGYPSDTFAVSYIRTNPWFSFWLQLIVATTIVCFGIMASVLVIHAILSRREYYQRNEERRKKECDLLL